jgi:SSS family solute:Na+ symporter
VNVVVLSVVGGYLVLCLVAGLAARGKASDSAAGYVAGDRTLGTLVMYFIMGATIFSAFAFLGAPGWAYKRGAAAFYILGFGTIGFVPFYFLGPRAARLGRVFGFVTQGEMVAARFGRPLIAGAMASISVLAFIPYLTLQMTGAGIVVHAVTGGGVSHELGAAIVYAVVLVYVLASGVLGVGWTNTLQGIFMMLLAWVLGFYVPYALYGGIEEMFRAIAAAKPEMLTVPGLQAGGEPWSFSEFASKLLVSAIGFSVWPHMFMKAFTARSDATLRRTVMLYPTFQLFIVPLLVVGFCGVLFTGEHPANPDEILPAILMQLDLPAVVVGLFCAGALAASMSSGDAIVHACASIVVRDGYVTALGRKVDPRRERTLIRAVVVVAMLLSYALMVFGDEDLVGLLLAAYSVVVQLVPAVVAALYLRRATGAGVLAGLGLGIAVNLYLKSHPELRPFAIDAGLYGLAVNVAVLAAVSWLGRGADRGSEEARFLEVARGSGSTRRPVSPESAADVL